MILRVTNSPKEKSTKDSISPFWFGIVSSISSFRFSIQKFAVVGAGQLMTRGEL